MTDKPILFSAPMVRALLDGRKTQTRRVLRPQPPQDLPYVGIYAPKLTAVFGGDCVDEEDIKIPLRYMPGDRLWVREPWRAMDGQDKFSGAQIAAQCLEAGFKRPWSPIQYETDGKRVNWYGGPYGFGDAPGRYRHARFMPRWASRLTLVVTQVRVQRVQDISDDDAIAEGINPVTYPHGAPIYMPCPGVWQAPFYAFKESWNRLHGHDAWDANPWVTALTFTVHHCNIDAMDAPCA